ncbi:MAG: CBS domain-containing protein, partial [Thermodesulfobacteriota bacterium]
MKIKDIMTKPVISAHEDETLREVALKMLDKRIGGLPVINDEG